MVTSMNYVKNTHDIMSWVEGIRCRHKNDHFSFLTGPEQTYKKKWKLYFKDQEGPFFFFFFLRLEEK